MDNESKFWKSILVSMGIFSEIVRSNYHADRQA